MNKPIKTSVSAEETKPGVGGEGDYASTRRYNEHVKKTVESQDVEELAEQAKRALQGDEKNELEEAERRAKRGPLPPKPDHSQR